jgi:uncharacterized protein (TIGR03437 family)
VIMLRRIPSALMLAIVGFCLFLATLALVFRRIQKPGQQVRPRRAMETTGHRINVPSGKDLQGALNAAQCGDTIVLDAVGVYNSAYAYRLGKRCGSQAITVMSSGAGSLPAGVRLDPGQQGGLLAKLVATGNEAVIQTVPGASGYKLIGLDITSNGAQFIPVLVNFGLDATWTQRETMTNFVVDRCFVHPAEISSSSLANASQYRTSERGLQMNVKDGWLINSYVAGFTGYYPNTSSIMASMGVFMDVGPGPLHVLNNYLEAWYSNAFFGGADASAIPAHTATIGAGATVGQATLTAVTDLAVGDLIAFQLNLPPAGSSSSAYQWGIGQVTGIAGTTVSFTPRTATYQGFGSAPIGGGLAQWKGDVLHDIEVRQNTLVKRPEWSDYSQPKNWVEVKAGRHVVIDGNRMVSGRATNVAFTVRNQNGSSPWIEINDLQFTNNWLTNFKGPAFGVQLQDNEKVTGLSGNITVRNNLLEGSTDSSSGLLYLESGYNLTFAHNTVLNNYTLAQGATAGFLGLVVKDNIVRNGQYGMNCSVSPGGINTCWPNLGMTGNVVIDNRFDTSAGSLASIYPTGNYYPPSDSAVGFLDQTNGNYRLAASSPYKGAASDGTDPGVNLDAMLAALSGAAQVPLPTPTPTPSATPTPSPTSSPTPTPSPSPTPTPTGTPTVSLTSPTSGSSYNAPADVTITASATDPNGTVAKVEFFQNGVLVGTDTSSPFSVVWSNVSNGNYTLTAKATDNQGSSNMSGGVSISVKKSPGSVGKAKGRANNLSSQLAATTDTTYAGAGDGDTSTIDLAAQTAADLDSLTQDIAQAYSDFLFERNLFGVVADRIDTQLQAALYFSRADSALAAKAGPNANVKNHLKRVAAHLTVTEDLMLYGLITPTTATLASSTNTRTDLVIGPAGMAYGPSSPPIIAPGSLVSAFGNATLSPLSTQWLFAAMSEANPVVYDLSGLTVTVAGRTAPVVYASPSRVSFYVPPTVTPGLAEVIITSQAGYVSRGIATVALNATRIMTTAEDESGPAVVLNAGTMTNGSFDISTSQNMGSDKRTRITFFATGISACAANSNPNNDVMVAGVSRPNFAESVAVEARTQDGHTVSLPVEFAGAQGLMPGLDEVTVVLTPQLKGAGVVQLTLILGGQRSNSPTITVR